MPSRLKALAPILLASAVAVGAFFAQRAGWLPTCARIHDSLGASGGLASVIFLVVATISSLLFVPRTVGLVAAAVGFDFWTAVFLVSLSSQLSATVAFLVARGIGRDYISGLAERNGWRVKLAAFVAENPLTFVVMTRFIHVLPYAGVNYVTGLLPVPFATYWWGTFLGMLPSTVLFTYLGAKIGCALVDGNMALPPEIRLNLFISAAGLTLIGVVPLLVLARRRKNN